VISPTLLGFGFLSAIVITIRGCVTTTTTQVPMDPVQGLDIVPPIVMTIVWILGSIGNDHP
jgi:hypothetical protein